MTDVAPLVMVVDDTPENIDVVVGILAPMYRLKVASDGARALYLMEGSQVPDLILLDIMMPDMDGFEVCRRLKANAITRDIPVIFLSALDQVEDKVKGFNCGGVDYVTKPFQAYELCARVATHIELYRVRKQLESHNMHLDEMVQNKTKQLSDALERLELADQSKSEFLNLISHEMRTPANGVFGVADLVFDSCSGCEVIKEWGPAYAKSKERMMSTLDDALLLAHVSVGKEQFRSEPVSLKGALGGAYNEAVKAGSAHYFTYDALPSCDAEVLGDEMGLQIALTSLLQTAAAFTVPETPVSISLSEDTDTVCLTFTGRGKSLRESAVDSFFSMFSDVRSSSPAEMLGLKPVVAEKIIAICGGRVEIRNLARKGIDLLVVIRKYDAFVDS